MLTKRLEKKLDRNCTRMLRTILKKSCKQHPTKQQLYSHQPPISKTTQIRYMGHYWRSKNKLISNVLLRISLHRCASIEQPTKTYLQQLCTDIRCSLVDLPEAIDDRRMVRVRVIHTSSMTWWWWFIYNVILFT